MKIKPLEASVVAFTFILKIIKIEEIKQRSQGVDHKGIFKSEKEIETWSDVMLC